MAGKWEAGRTEWKMDVIFPVSTEMTMVADVRRPDITALDDTNTEIVGVSILAAPLAGDRGGVG